MTKVAAKKSESKKPETKKAPVKKSAAKAVKQDKKGPGRPPGPLRVPEWIDVIDHTLLARKNGKNQDPGYGSVKLRAGKDGAVHLERIAELINNKDQRLLKLLK